MFIVTDQDTSIACMLRSSLNTTTLPVLPHSLQQALSIPHPHRTGLHSIHPLQPQSRGSRASGHSASCVLLILSDLSASSHTHMHTHVLRGLLKPIDISPEHAEHTTCHVRVQRPRVRAQGLIQTSCSVPQSHNQKINELRFYI